MQINLQNVNMPGVRKTRVQRSLADMMAARSELNTLTDTFEARANSRSDSAELRNHHSSILEELRNVSQQMQQAREAGEAAAEAWRIKLKALRIAARIMNGDNVPQADYDFLMEHNPALFKLALSVRIPNEDPHDYDALSDGEGDNAGTAAADVIGADALSGFGVPTSGGRPSVSSGSSGGGSTVRATPVSRPS